MHLAGVSNGHAQRSHFNVAPVHATLGLDPALYPPEFVLLLLTRACQISTVKVDAWYTPTASEPPVPPTPALISWDTLIGRSAEFRFSPDLIYNPQRIRTADDPQLAFHSQL